MEFAVFSFVVVFLLVASGGLLLFYRQAMVQRISDGGDAASRSVEIC